MQGKTKVQALSHVSYCCRVQSKQGRYFSAGNKSDIS